MKFYNKIMKIWNGFLDYQSLVKLEKKLSKKLNKKICDMNICESDLGRLQGQIDMLKYLNNGEELWSIEDSIHIKSSEVVMTATMRVKESS